MTRGLWRLGEYESRLPHVHLIERLESEDPRRHFRVGERVGYVLVQRDVGDQLYKKSEDPATALRRRLPLDLDEYLKQVGAWLGAHNLEFTWLLPGFSGYRSLIVSRSARPSTPLMALLTSANLVSLGRCACPWCVCCLW